MGFELCNGETVEDPAPADPEVILSFFLASDLIIKGFAEALCDLAAPSLEASIIEAGAVRRRRRLSDGCPTVVPEPPPEVSINALAARCAILLQRDLET